jgi:hypothetical protein
MNVLFTIIVLAVVVLALYAVFIGVRRSREGAKTTNVKTTKQTFDLSQPVTPQQLSALAQPYRSYLGEAVQIHQEVAARSKTAPPALQQEVTELAFRLEMLVKRALPRAEHGTKLSEFLLELTPSEAQYAQTQTEAGKVQEELEHLVDTLKTLRGSLYQVLTDATNLGKDTSLATDLHDALLEVEGLEAAFKETDDFASLPTATQPDSTKT